MVSAARAGRFHAGSSLPNPPGVVWKGEGKEGLCPPSHPCSGGPTPAGSQLLGFHFKRENTEEFTPGGFLPCSPRTEFG